MAFFHLLLGLGKKNVSLLEDGDSEDICWELMDAFPKLKDAGGYELLRVVDRGRSLEVIPLPEDGYTVPYLKDVVQQAKIYIRPIQRDLSLTQLHAATVSLCISIAHVMLFWHWS